jgi:hypothetical protein
VSDRTPTRVRVTGPPRRRAGRPSAPARRHIDAQSRLGEVYLSSLLREQLRLAVLSLAVLVCTVVSQPLLFWLAPGLAGVRVLGAPLPWLLLGVGVYPLLVLVGWRFVRAAERNEDDFAHLVESVDDS